MTNDKYEIKYDSTEYDYVIQLLNDFNSDHIKIINKDDAQKILRTLTAVKTNVGFWFEQSNVITKQKNDLQTSLDRTKSWSEATEKDLTLNIKQKNELKEKIKAYEKSNESNKGPIIYQKEIVGGMYTVHPEVDKLLDEKPDIIGVMDTIDASTWIESDGRKTVKHECDLCSKCVSNLIRYKCGDHELIKCNCDDGEWVKTNDGFTWKSKPNKPTNDYSDTNSIDEKNKACGNCNGADPIINSICGSCLVNEKLTNWTPTKDDDSKPNEMTLEKLDYMLTQIEDAGYDLMDMLSKAISKSLLELTCGECNEIMLTGKENKLAPEEHQCYLCGNLVSVHVDKHITTVSTINKSLAQKINENDRIQSELSALRRRVKELQYDWMDHAMFITSSDDVRLIDMLIKSLLLSNDNSAKKKFCAVHGLDYQKYCGNCVSILDDRDVYEPLPVKKEMFECGGCFKMISKYPCKSCGYNW